MLLLVSQVFLVFQKIPEEMVRLDHGVLPARRESLGEKRHDYVDLV